jgi:tetratricopeptide (TPR) repeat protein
MRRLIAVGFLLLAAAPAAAQQPAIASRVTGALDQKLVDPACKLTGGDFKVSSGKTYLKSAIETSNPDARSRMLRDGVRVISEAIGSGQSGSSQAWYWLGRNYLQQGDLVGADSAFTRVEKITPACKADTDKQRYRAWAALVNAGSEFRKNNTMDSALVMFTAANSIYRDAPLSYMNMAEIFNSQKMPDSALAYYTKATMTEPTDSAQVKLRDQALFNTGALLSNAGKAAEAIPMFEKYLTRVPDDVGAKKALANAYRATGQTEKAQAMEKELVAAGGAATAAAGAGEGEGLTEADLIDLGTKQYNDKNYKEAAATFGKVLELNPNQRDAIYIQANAYLAMQDGANLASSAEKLIALEPLSEYAYSMRAQGYKFAKNTDKVVEAITAREALPVNVEIEKLKVAGSDVSLTGKATGREARNSANKVIPPAPTTIVVEFLDEKGTVVGSQETTIPALQPGATQPIQVDGKVDGVKAWRYKVK